MNPKRLVERARDRINHVSWRAAIATVLVAILNVQGVRTEAGDADTAPDWIRGRAVIENAQHAELLFLDATVHGPLLLAAGKDDSSWRDALLEGEGVNQFEPIDDGKFVRLFAERVMGLTLDQPGEALANIPVPETFLPDIAAIVSNSRERIFLYAETTTGRMRFLDEHHVVFERRRDPRLVAQALTTFSHGILDAERRRIAGALDSQVRSTLENPSSVDLYSLDPTKYEGFNDEQPSASGSAKANETPIAAELRRLKSANYIVIGSVSIHRDSIRRELTRRTMQAVTSPATRMMCFEPRHAIVVEGPGGPVVIKLCFTCNQAYVLTDRGEIHTPLGSDGTGLALSSTLNGILRRHGIKLAK